MKHPITKQVSGVIKARLFTSAARELIKIVGKYKVGPTREPLFSVEAKAFSKCINLLNDPLSDELDSVLNDAGSTLAALNMTKDLVDKGREEYWEKMYESFDVFVVGPIEQENEHKEKLLSMSYDELAKAHRRIEELEEALKGMVDVYSFGGSGDSDARKNATEKAESLLKQQ